MGQLNVEALEKRVVIEINVEEGHRFSDKVIVEALEKVFSGLDGVDVIVRSQSDWYELGEIDWDEFEEES